MSRPFRPLSERTAELVAIGVEIAALASRLSALRRRRKRMRYALYESFKRQLRPRTPEIKARHAAVQRRYKHRQRMAKLLAESQTPECYHGRTYDEARP